MSRITDFHQAERYNPEQLLVEAVRAEDAGVFRRSPVDPVALLTPIVVGVRSETSGRIGGSRRWLSVVRMAAPLAACLVIWVGFRSAMDTSELTNPSVSPNVFSAEGSVANGDADCKGLTLSQFTDCLGNTEGSSLSGHCACADADQDGDFDLADFGHLQRSLKLRRG